ncbi:MAG TPA: energy transducer TonB [Thermoanaerobaculia bacterium]|nr:energy transducer TonB [Thermoanaerobaculia bacterium]
MKRPRGLILILLIALLPISLAAGTEPPPDSLAGRLAGIDGLLRSGEWSRAEEAARLEIARSRRSLSASVLAAGLARLALAEAGLGREEAVWHWQMAQGLDRDILPEATLRTFGAPGELLSRHPLRPAGQAPPGLEVHSLGGAVEPPRRTAGELPELSQALRSLSVPLWICAQLIIDAEGRPRDPVLLGASLPGMSLEVLEAVRNWRFQPARKEGRPVAVFYQFSLNPVAEKPLSEIAHSSRQEVAELDGLLRAGRWKEADRKGEKLWTALDGSLGWKDMGLFLTLRALAEAGLGARDEAICHWQAAQHLDPDLYHADLAAYGAAGALLEANRWGLVLDDGDPAARRTPPALKKAKRVTLRGVRTPISERLLMAGIIDSNGHVRQPVLLSNQQQQNLLATWDTPMERMVAMNALVSVCSWRFEPARIGDQPLMAASRWTVGIGNAQVAPFDLPLGFPHPEFGQGPSLPQGPRTPAATAPPP